MRKICSDNRDHLIARVIVANPLQVKAIAHAHVKTDKIDAGVLASLRASGS
jgi:transposase